MGNPKVTLALFLTMIGCVVVSMGSVAYMAAQQPPRQSAIAAAIKPDTIPSPQASEPVQEPVPAIAPVTEQASNPTPSVCNQAQPTRMTSFSSMVTVRANYPVNLRLRTDASTPSTIAGVLPQGQTVQVLQGVFQVNSINWLNTADGRFLAMNDSAGNELVRVIQ
jgi:hypothetical protein